MMFGHAGKHEKQKPKVKPKKVVVDVTLEQVYKGDLIQVDIKRYRLCEACHGKGGEDVQSCKNCKGKGITTKLVEIGHGMYQQMQEYCDNCKGKGEICDEEKRCKECKGEKVVEKEVKLPVTLNKGTPHGANLVIPDEGDEIVTNHPYSAGRISRRRRCHLQCQESLGFLGQEGRSYNEAQDFVDRGFNRLRVQPDSP